MTSFKTLYPSTYLQQADLQGREVSVVIAELRTEKVGDDEKPVLYFQNKTKGMVLNFGNANTIADLYGDDIEAWPGHELVLYVDPTVMYAGKRVGGLRVKTPARRNGPPPRTQLEVQDRGSYKTSSMKPAEPPADDAGDSEIPF